MYTQEYTTTGSAIRNRFQQFDSVKLHVGSREGDETFGADFFMGTIDDPGTIPDSDVPVRVQEFNYQNMQNTLYINMQGIIPDWH